MHRSWTRVEEAGLDRTGRDGVLWPQIEQPGKPRILSPKALNLGAQPGQLLGQRRSGIVRSRTLTHTATVSLPVLAASHPQTLACNALAPTPESAEPYLFWYGSDRMNRPADTYRRRLWDRALDQYGYVTTTDAAQLDIPPVELRKLAGRGLLDRIDRGTYRFPDAPTSARDAFMEAVLWAGPDAVLAYDAVLALHDLALANPRTLRVITPHRVRKSQSRDDITLITARLSETDRTTYFRIPSTTVARALVDSRDLIMTDRLLEAAEQARREGLLLTAEHDAVVRELTGTS
jgi:hypothetical protein